jgi:putative transposase
MTMAATSVVLDAGQTSLSVIAPQQVKRLKELELENSRLRKAVSDLTLDKLILQEAARGNF